MSRSTNKHSFDQTFSKVCGFQRQSLWSHSAECEIQRGSGTKSLTLHNSKARLRKKAGELFVCADFRQQITVFWQAIRGSPLLQGFPSSKTFHRTGLEFIPFLSALRISVPHSAECGSVGLSRESPPDTPESVYVKHQILPVKILTQNI